jgi:hypothetical protein
MAAQSALRADAAEQRRGGNDYAGAAAAAVSAVLARADALERIVRLFTLPPILYACEAESSGWWVLRVAHDMHRCCVCGAVFVFCMHVYIM